MKKSAKMMTIAFLSGVFLSAMTAVVSAGEASGSYAYYDCNDFYYKFKNTVYTDDVVGLVRGRTEIDSVNPNIKIPVGWAGAQAIVYNKNTGKRVTETPMGYNYAADIGWIATTPIYNTKNGTFYTDGLVQAYHPSDKNAVYYPYHQYIGFASPYQTISIK